MLLLPLTDASCDNDQTEGNGPALSEQRLHLCAKECGGWLPEQPVDRFHRILDLACGPGTWGLEVARMHSTSQIIGGDEHPEMIAYATTQARERELPNAQFQVLHPQGPFDFAAASFDLVNCFVSPTLLRKDQWTTFLQECRRLLCPGGIIRLTAGELGISTSPAHEHYCRLLARALFEGGYTFAPDDRHLGIVQTLPYLLNGAEFTNIQKVYHVIDYSSMAERFDAWRHHLLLQVQKSAAFLISTNITTAEEMKHLLLRLHNELSWSFCAHSILVTCWASR